MVARVFSTSDWDEEFLALFSRRMSPPTCPACQRSGFFGPRKAASRLYEMCKFCGRYQEPDKNPVQLIATAHNCREWPQVLGAPYIWWVQPFEGSYSCPTCGDEVKVPSATVKRPVDDRDHPWWSVPQGMTFDAARQYWVEHGQARVYL